MAINDIEWYFLKVNKPPICLEVWVYVMTNRKRPVTLYTYIPSTKFDGKKLPAKWHSVAYGIINTQPVHQWRLNITPNPPDNAWETPCPHPARNGRHEAYCDDSHPHYCRACGAVCGGCKLCEKMNR